MPVTSQQIISDRSYGPTQRKLRYRYTFSTGEVYNLGPIFVLSDFDADADLLARIPAIEDKYASNEDSLIIPAVEDGGDPVTLVLDPTHSTSKRLAKALIYWMIRERDPYIVLLLEPLIVYLQANYTNQQLLNFLDLTAAQGQKMNNKINAILNSKADLLTADLNRDELNG